MYLQTLIKLDEMAILNILFERKTPFWKKTKGAKRDKMFPKVGLGTLSILIGPLGLLENIN